MAGVACRAARTAVGERRAARPDGVRCIGVASSSRIVGPPDADRSLQAAARQQRSPGDPADHWSPARDVRLPCSHGQHLILSAPAIVYFRHCHRPRQPDRNHHQPHQPESGRVGSAHIAVPASVEQHADRHEPDMGPDGRRGERYRRQHADRHEPDMGPERTSRTRHTGDCEAPGPARTRTLPRIRIGRLPPERSSTLPPARGGTRIPLDARIVPAAVRQGWTGQVPSDAGATVSGREPPAVPA